MHACSQCGGTVEQHPEMCEVGCMHFPPLCCPGCDCRSFETAQHEPDDLLSIPTTRKER